MIAETKKQWARERLQEKSRELQRVPKKEDFTEVERSRIKAFLGPWPRALEAAGLKAAKKTREEKKKHEKQKKTNLQSFTGNCAASGNDSGSVHGEG